VAATDPKAVKPPKAAPRPVPAPQRILLHKQPSRTESGTLIPKSTELFSHLQQYRVRLFPPVRRTLDPPPSPHHEAEHALW
jgi:hypothetical protein